MLYRTLIEESKTLRNVEQAMMTDFSDWLGGWQFIPA